MKKSSNISAEIRSIFLNYFEKNSHKILLSSPLIPKNDPSLLFTNSGMVQFKDWFIGNDKPDFKNVATVQKCIRAGGKHNDLENVGFTPRHHTFFEMLGNFSFGGYFKEESIELAWKLLTKELELNKKKLVVTVFHEDEVSLNVWKKISGFSDDQIIRISSDDNFWSMGDDGPCGPCSEIFFDNGNLVDGGLPGTKNQDGERYVEIWNLVFMEFQNKNGNLKKLPNLCVDTGMGLERITAVLSGKKSNFETDLFQTIFSDIEKTTGIKKNPNLKNSFTIISDHIRAIVFLLSEGILPSNEGRGYVLRRIIRRALMHVHKIRPNALILYKLVESVVNKYSDIYFELSKGTNFIKENLKNEETKFSDTLGTGIELLNKEISHLKGDKFPPEIAFKLYDTYGFPVDMTTAILNEKKIFLDSIKYNSIVQLNKNKQKNSWKGSGEIKQNNFIGNLKSELNLTKFVGYEKFDIKAKLKRIIINNEFKESVKAKSRNLILIFNSTPFYAESGGQVGDIGSIYNEKNELVAEIVDTQKASGDIFLHFVNNNNLDLEIENYYFLKIDLERRIKIRNNHSATHLLHESLRQIVGDHVSQRGSLVNDDKLRFDYSSNKPLIISQTNKVEELVNNSIRSNIKVVIQNKQLKKAIDEGAIALFGEKYPDNVRVVSMKNNNEKNVLTSVELCGGTHCGSTGEIGFFKILSDSSIASGIRRIEALTGNEARNYVSNKIYLLDDIKDILKATDENLFEKIENLKNENLNLRKTSTTKTNFFSPDNILSFNNLKVYFQEINCEAKDLKNNCDLIKNKFESGIVIIYSVNDSKVSMVVSVTNNLIEKYDSVELLKNIIKFIGGKGGGGRKDLAQGGANFNLKINKLKNSLKKILEI
ncbi:MAG: alanine--tRNA ligase [Rickettsiales bacterium]|nr:alanine--tRNA ligase [Rickettsiales bacterium]